MKRQPSASSRSRGLLEKFDAPISTVVRHGEATYVTGVPPFEPNTG
jgi:hypothetical protein